MDGRVVVGFMETTHPKLRPQSFGSRVTVESNFRSRRSSLKAARTNFLGMIIIESVSGLIRQTWRQGLNTKAAEVIPFLASRFVGD